METEFYSDLKSLRLHYLAENMDTFLSKRQDKSPREIINDIVRLEITEKSQRSVNKRVKDARLGKYRHFSEFDWNWPKELDRGKLKTIMDGDIVKAGRNLILIGTGGLGKTMIAKNIALMAIHKGYTARFITASKLVSDLLTAGHRLETRLRYFSNLDLLVIDELGYLSFQNKAADLLFEVVSRRYENAPIIITTNLAFKDWPMVFPGAACVSALLDRLIHHCDILKITGDSFRKNESLKQGGKPNV